MGSLGGFLPTAVFAAIIALGLYLRLRRTFGRQPLRPRRMVVRMALLIVVAGMTLSHVTSAADLVAPIAGALLGGALGLVGLALTRFDVTAQGRFYTPNPWIGLAVAALFLGRLAARLFTIREVMAHAAAEPGGDGLAAMSRSPLTLAAFLLLASYYVAYYAGVLWRSHLAASASARALTTAADDAA